MPALNNEVRTPRRGSKERISTAAFTLFAEKGFDGTTTRAIAERAGVNEVTIFRTFGSKDALFRQVAREMLPCAASRRAWTFGSREARRTCWCRTLGSSLAS